MSYANILLQIDLDAFPTATVHLAARLADRYGARLIGAAAEGLRPPLVVDGVAVDDEATRTAERARIEAQLGTVEQRFRGLVGHLPDIDWRGGVAAPAANLLRHARAADLILLPRRPYHGDSDPLRTVDPAEIVVEAGRPVLVVPWGRETISARSVVVAWKNTREARRALRESVRFLASAEEVTLLGIQEPDATEPIKPELEDVAGYLRRHAVTANVSIRREIKGTVADELILAASAAGADLIVAGAYGHSRFREWVLGGVTRDLIRDAPVPCFFSH